MYISIYQITDIFAVNTPPMPKAVAKDMIYRVRLNVFKCSYLRPAHRHVPSGRQVVDGDLQVACIVVHHHDDKD